MPYVSDDLRKIVDKELEQLKAQINVYAPDNSLNGILNYCITDIVVNCIKSKYGELRYAGINDMIGVLECAKLELYRRAASPYEDRCIVRNGDVRAYE